MFIVIALITGTLIGMIGVGGVLLAPFLTYAMGIELHEAMAMSSLSFLFTGIVATIVYSRKGSIEWKPVLWLCVGIVPATVLGAKVNSVLETSLLTVILAALIAFSGLHVCLKKQKQLDGSAPIRPVFYALIGFVVGFGSALTGTGGPVLLIPILMFLNVPVLVAIGISQVVQLPIAVFASVGFSLYGHLDIKMGVMLGLIQAGAVLIGAKMAHYITADKLRRIVAVALIGVGILMTSQVLFQTE